MLDHYHTLLSRVRACAEDPYCATSGGRLRTIPPNAIRCGNPINPPIDVDTWTRAEHKLGVTLPVLLRAIYTTIGNGGFGPGCGFTFVRGPLINEPEPHFEYLAYRYNWEFKTMERMTERFVRIADYGCAMAACIDWTVPDGPIYTFDPVVLDDGKPIEACFTQEADSLQAWLERWLQAERDQDALE